MESRATVDDSFSVENMPKICKSQVFGLSQRSVTTEVGSESESESAQHSSLGVLRTKARVLGGDLAGDIKSPSVSILSDCAPSAMSAF